MKLVVVAVVLAACCGSAYCAGSPISLTPGNNSHYVEGESRYIWMPDGDNVPHLVDLQENVFDTIQPVSGYGVNNRYWLYTRRNPNSAQVITMGDAKSLLDSNYQSNRALKVIVHGWWSNGNSGINTMLTEAFLAVDDCNVIVVDWGELSSSNYFTASSGVPSVGLHLGTFLTWVINTADGNWNNVHLVGFSLGAHVVGTAGRQTGNRPRRITGLDPAGPTWGGNSNALRASDGQYVEAIHTDGGVLGIMDPIARVNFYPNGGRNAQPGCWIDTCSHSRAYELMAASIRHNHLIGKQCSNLNEARSNSCSGPTLHMGNAILKKDGDGLYALSTGSSFPF